MRRGNVLMNVRGIGLCFKTGKSGGTADSRCNIPTYTDHQTAPRTLLSCSLSSIFSASLHTISEDKSPGQPGVGKSPGQPGE
jgi:hypothetical protein